jgi:hypothetical protein
MQCCCAAAGVLPVFPCIQLHGTVSSNNGRSVSEGEVGVLKIKGESGISGEVSAVSSGSYLHSFCKSDFSNLPPFHGCVVQMLLCSGSFQSAVQYHFLSMARCSDLLRAGRSGDRNPAEAISQARPWGPTQSPIPAFLKLFSSGDHFYQSECSTDHPTLVPLESKLFEILNYSV